MNPKPAGSSNAFWIYVSCVKRHPMTWRVISAAARPRHRPGCRCWRRRPNRGVIENKHSTEVGAWLTVKVNAHTGAGTRFVETQRLSSAGSQWGFIEIKHSTEIGAWLTIKVNAHTGAGTRFFEIQRLLGAGSQLVDFGISPT